MPELPEVETIAAMLRAGGAQRDRILGCRIKKACVFWARSLANLSPQDFCNQVAGQKITEIGRRGKFVVITLSQDTLLIHLRMSGDLRVEKACHNGEIPHETQKHDRLLLEFEDRKSVV